jgi:hypothetical protein
VLEAKRRGRGDDDEDRKILSDPKTDDIAGIGTKETRPAHAQRARIAATSLSPMSYA